LPQNVLVERKLDGEHNVDTEGRKRTSGTQ
jgi:hypothetical protein